MPDASGAPDINSAAVGAASGLFGFGLVIAIKYDLNINLVLFKY
jgi:hypothetical protein